MEKDKSRFIIWLLIVIIVLLVTIIFGLAIKLKNENSEEILKDNDVQVSINNNTNENQTTSNEEIGDKIDDIDQIESVINKYGVKMPDDKDVHVYSYIDQKKVIEKASGLNTNLTISLRIPQLKFDTEVAKKINDDILSKFEDYIKAFDENKYTSRLADMKLIADYDYIYTVSENRIYLNVSKVFNNSNASGSEEVFSYIYDITNDKQISITDLFAEKGITTDKITQELYKDSNFNVSYGNNEEAKKYVQDSLNNNFSNVRIENIIVDENYANVKAIYLYVGVYRDSYRLVLGI